MSEEDNEQGTEQNSGQGIDDPSDRPTPERLAGSSGKGLSRLIAVVALSILAVYAVRLTGRVFELQRASLAEQRLGADVGMINAEVIALETAVAGAGSDAFTERWAREERGWIQEGDQPLQIIEATATPSPQIPDGTGAEDGFLRRLRRWLSGAEAEAEPESKDP